MVGNTNDILTASVEGLMSAVVLIDLRTAFHKNDYHFQLQVLEHQMMNQKDKIIFNTQILICGPQ